MTTPHTHHWNAIGRCRCKAWQCTFAITRSAGYPRVRVEYCDQAVWKQGRCQAHQARVRVVETAGRI